MHCVRERRNHGNCTHREIELLNPTNCTGWYDLVSAGCSLPSYPFQNNCSKQKVNSHQALPYIQLLPPPHKLTIPPHFCMLVSAESLSSCRGPIAKGIFKSSSPTTATLSPSLSLPPQSFRLLSPHTYINPSNLLSSRVSTSLSVA